MQLTKGAIGNLINRYKAVLKKCHLLNVFGSLAVAGMLIMGGAGGAVAAAGDVALGGGTHESAQDADHLMGGTLYKGDVSTPEASTPGNISLTIKGGAIEEIIGGSYVAGDNTSIKSVVHANISTIIESGSSAEFVVGGSKIANDADATLTTGKTALTINGGNFGQEGKDAGYELVIGGNYVKTGTDTQNTATSEGASVVINGGTFHASVVGGSVAHRYAGNNTLTVTDNGSTSVAINGGTFAPSQSSTAESNGGINLSPAVIGGGLAYGGSSSVLGSRDNPVTSNVTISGGGITGKVVAGSAAVNGSTAMIHGNSQLNVSGGTFAGDLIGGGFAEHAFTPDKGYSLNITGDTGVSMSGGTLDGEIIGGSYISAGGTGKVANSSVVISGGRQEVQTTTKAQYVIGGNKAMAFSGSTTTALVEGTSSVSISGKDTLITGGAVIGGGMAQAADSGQAVSTVKNSRVSVEDGSLAGIIGGGLAETSGIADGGSATSEVTGTSSVAVSGGTITGHVVAGGLADGSHATAKVTNADLSISGGSIHGNVYTGGAALNGGSSTVDNFDVRITGGTITGDIVAGNHTGASTLAQPYSGGISKGSITIGGDATIGGGVIVDDNVTADVIIDGTGAAVKDGYTGNAGSSLTFSNYDGTFDNAATGFGTLNVAEGSHVRMDSLISGQRGSDDPKGFFGSPAPTPGVPSIPHALTITGGGTVTVTGEFHVNPGAPVTIESGNLVAENVKIQEEALTVGGANAPASFTVNKELVYEGTGTVVVENLGTATLGKDIVLDSTGELKDLDAIQTQVNAGGTLKIEGLDNIELSEADIEALKGLTSTDGTPGQGLLDLGGADLSAVADENGTVGYDTVAGIITDSLKDTTVAVTDAQNGNGISGGFNDVKLTGAATALNAKDTLHLDGSVEGGNLVSQNDGKLADLRIGSASGTSAFGTTAVTLGNEDAANKGTLGNVILDAGTNKKATLNVVGNGEAEFTIGDVTAGESDDSLGTDAATVSDGDTPMAFRAVSPSAVTAGQSANTINVSGATLNTGDITVGDGDKDIDLHVTGGTVNSQSAEIATATLTNGVMNAKGDLTVDTAMLANGLLTAGAATAKDSATGGNITITNALSGQGTVAAQNTLTLANAYTGAEGDALLLTADKLEVDAIDSASGDLAIAAKKLVTNADTLLKNDTLVADKATLGGALNADGRSSMEVGAFFTNDTFETEGLAQAVTVKGASLMAYGTSADQARQGVAETGHTGTAYYAGKELKLAAGGSLTVGDVAAGGTTVAFGGTSLLVVDGTAMNGKTVFTGPDGASAAVDEGSRLHVDNAVIGDFTVFGTGFDTKPDTGWAEDKVTTDSAMLDATYDQGTSSVSIKTNDARIVFPELSHELAAAVNTLYHGKLNDVASEDMGIRFLSRAINDHFLGTDHQAAAATVESASRIAFAGAVPQMTRMASDAATNAVVNRLGFASPADGAQAMNAEGKIVDRDTTGFALWIAPLWQNQHGWDMEADSMDYGFNGNLGGVSLGADYTFENAIRAGITFNIGGGYAESSGGDLNSTQNDMTFWGLGAYAGWHYENFGLMADVSYTSTWNGLKQDIDSRMGMGDLEADVQATAISAGLRAEYKLETSVLDIIPHIGVRYMSLNTWGYDVDTNGGTVLEGDGFHQDIWTFPVGVTFSKDIALDSGWTFKPSVDFSVIPAAGDIKAKSDVAFTGLPGTYEVETQTMDYLTWQGGVGLEMGNDTMSFGVNYTLQAGQHTTGHGVFGSFRYEF